MTVLDHLPLAPVVQVLPADMEPTFINGVPVRLSDNWEGRRGPTKSKKSAVFLAHRMAHKTLAGHLGYEGTVGDAFVVRHEAPDFWSVRMLLDADGQPLHVRHTDQ